MKKISTKVIALTIGLVSVCATGSVFAGNKDRAGQAGAQELLINPWARSSGWACANSAGVRGLESIQLNVAGAAFTRKTEIIFAHTNWLLGTGVKINSFGFSQRVGETGSLGIGFMSMNLGTINTTTVDNPEGGIGTFSPQMNNVNLFYSKGFSDNIYGGINVKVITGGISNVKTSGVAFDAGIQYLTGKYDHIKFGISLRNVGPKLRYSGDGLSFRTPTPNGNSKTMTAQQRTGPYELPSLVNIGGAYDIFLKHDSTNVKLHRVTVAATFTSNSFTNDNYRLGLEYGFKNILMVRAGYDFQKDILNEKRSTALTGFSAGASVEIPFTASKSTFALDYSYQTSNPFQGVHSLGVRVNL